MGAGAWEGRAGSQGGTAPAHNRDHESWRLGPQLHTAVAASPSVCDGSQAVAAGPGSSSSRGDGSGSVLPGSFSLGSVALAWLGGPSGRCVGLGPGCRHRAAGPSHGLVEQP